MLLSLFADFELKTQKKSPKLSAHRALTQYYKTTTIFSGENLPHQYIVVYIVVKHKKRFSTLKS